MTSTILVTGGAGLVGTALRSALALRGYDTRSFDLSTSTGRRVDDTRDGERLAEAMAGCAGVVHLAAVSRVVWGERNPLLCRAVNVGGTRNVLRAALDRRERPFVLFAGSREVYGHVTRMPIDEDAPLAPINVYGRSKLAGEHLTLAARDAGLRTAIFRLSNVYGSVDDHADRVAPAFARAAITGAPLRVEGRNHVFDFNHVADVADGIARLVVVMASEGGLPPPVQFVSGVGTTLQDLAETCVRLAGSDAPVRQAQPRDFDVGGFVGRADRARRLLGWRTTIPLERGLATMIGAMRSRIGESDRGFCAIPRVAGTSARTAPAALAQIPRLV